MMIEVYCLEKYKRDQSWVLESTVVVVVAELKQWYHHGFQRACLFHRKCGRRMERIHWVRVLYHHCLLMVKLVWHLSLL
jgi:hypothetical protein